MNNRLLAFVVQSFVVFAVTLLAVAYARAADFAVNPMKLELAPGQRSGEIKIQNFDKAVVRFQIRASDCEGATCAATTKDLLFFPRAIEIAPGESRIVRVGLRGLSPRERRYAVHLLQVAIADESTAAAGAYAQVLLAVQVSVTVPAAQPAKRK